MGKGPKVPEDFQRNEVYRWERAKVFPHLPQLGFDEADALVRRVFRDARLRQPEVDHTDPNTCPEFDVEKWRISLPEDWCSAPIIVHEAAHAKVHVRYGYDGISPHGGEFMRTYVRLLVRYCGFYRSDLMRSALYRGLAIAR